LPVENLFNLAAATVRLFDRYGERKSRMKARMKFLVGTFGWDKFREALDQGETESAQSHWPNTWTD
jgi:sulfite reductase (ferredoxin)